MSHESLYRPDLRSPLPAAKALEMHRSSVSLVVDVEQKLDVAVVRCRGRLVSGLGDFLDTQVRRLLPRCKRIILDFAEVYFIDAGGAATLARLFELGRISACPLELANLRHTLCKLPALLNLQSCPLPPGDRSATPNRRPQSSLPESF